MPYNIKLHKAAQRELEKSPIKDRLIHQIRNITQLRNPNHHEKVCQLRGHDVYRVKVGDWRVIFDLNKPDLEILQVVKRDRIDYDSLPKVYDRR